MIIVFLSGSASGSWLMHVSSWSMILLHYGVCCLLWATRWLKFRRSSTMAQDLPGVWASSVLIRILVLADASCSLKPNENHLTWCSHDVSYLVVSRCILKYDRTTSFLQGFRIILVFMLTPLDSLPSLSKKLLGTKVRLGTLSLLRIPNSQTSSPVESTADQTTDSTGYFGCWLLSSAKQMLRTNWFSSCQWGCGSGRGLPSRKVSAVPMHGPTGGLGVTQAKPSGMKYRYGCFLIYC